MRRDAVKSALRTVGLYPLVRRWWRGLNPELRRKRYQESEFYRRFVGVGDLCFDVGANVGQTIEALIACQARVVAVEPNPFCFDALKWQFGSLPDVTLVNKAIGKTIGTAEFHFSGTNGTGSLRQDWPFPNEETRTVELTTLDDLIARYGRPKLCKIDVEGCELEVFRGLSQPIPIIRFEFHRSEFQTTRDCFARLEEVGRIRSANATTLDDADLVHEDFLPPEDLIARLEASGIERGNVILKMED
jgi:FkbM family methyltransferase